MAPEADVPPELRAQVLALHEHAWGSGDAHDPALSPVSMLLVDGDVAAALDILSKELTHRGEQYQASGLSTVVTDPTRRSRGIGLELVRAAREQIAASGADLAMFTTSTCGRERPSRVDSAAGCRDGRQSVQLAADSDRLGLILPPIASVVGRPLAGEATAGAEVPTTRRLPRRALVLVLALRSVLAEVHERGEDSG